MNDCVLSFEIKTQDEVVFIRKYIKKNFYVGDFFEFKTNELNYKAYYNSFQDIYKKSGIIGVWNYIIKIFDRALRFNKDVGEYFLYVKSKWNKRK